LCASVSSSDNGTPTGEHPRQLRRHDQVGRFGTLWKKMNVGKVQQVVQPIEWLKW
jgi:hypothetical protein